MCNSDFKWFIDKDGHDMISIQMLKTCDKSICKPVAIIFGHAQKIKSSSLIEKRQCGFCLQKRQ